MARPNPDCPSYFIKQLSLGDTRIGHGSTGKSRGRGGLPALRTRGALSYYVPQDLFSLLPDVRLATTRLGITLRGIRRVREALIRTYGTSRFEQMSTADVNFQWVRPLTFASRCRLVELREVVPAEDVGPPMYFISHAWSNRVAQLFSHVETFLAAADDDTCVWIDILSVNQHADTPYHRADISAFKEVVAACGGGTVVVAGDVVQCNPALRGWCIYEWSSTLATHGPDGLHMSLEPSQRSLVVNTLDVETAQTQFPDDKAMILADVMALHGSTAAFNHKLRLQLLLEPLNYSVDLRRLLQRAEGSSSSSSSGTEWSFRAVEEWLREEGDTASGGGGVAGAAVSPEGAGCEGASGSGGGAGSGSSSQGGLASRALVVVAGAGEGKSTISAALVTGALRERFAAYHFFKYNDARRQEAVQVLKSLAFQLAGRLPCVRDALLSLDGAAVAQLGDPEEAFGVLLQQPLERYAQEVSALPPGSRPAPLVVLLDALDEADPPEEQAGGQGQQQQQQQQQQRESHMDQGHTGPRVPRVRGNTGLALLTLQLARLPAHLVRFVLTTRPDAAAGQVLPCLRRAFGGQQEEEGGVAMAAGLVELAPPDFRSAGGEDGSSSSSSSGGVLVCRAVEELCRMLGVPGLPPVGQQPERDGAGGSAGNGGCGDLADLYGLYSRLFRHAFVQYSSVQAEQVRRLLAVLLAAQEPLTQAVVQQLGLGCVLTLLPGWGVLYFVDEHRVYSLHKSLSDYLLGDDAGGAAARWAACCSSWGGVDVRQGHLALACLLAQPPALCAPSPYALKYLLHHLAMACVGGGGPAAAAAAPARGDVGVGGTGPEAAPAAAAPAAGGKAASKPASLLDTVLGNFSFVQRAVTAGHGWRLVAALGPHISALEAAGSHLCGEALRFLRSGLQDVGSTPLVTLALRLLPVRSPLYALAVAAREEQAGVSCTRVMPDDGWSACLAILEMDSAAKSVCWSPDGRQLAAGYRDRKVRVWDAATDTCNAVLEGHSDEVTSVAWSPSGQQLATSSADGCIRLWDVATGQCTATLRSSGYVHTVCWSPDGRQVACGDGHDVGLWDAATGQRTATLTGHEDIVRSVCWSPDGQTLASGSTADFSTDGNNLRLWDAADGTCTATLAGHSDGVRCVRWSPDGRQLASGSKDNTVRLWDAVTGQCSAVLEHAGKCTGVAWTPDGRHLVSVSNRAISVWDTATGQHRTSLAVSDYALTDVAFSPDGRQFATAAKGPTLRLWSASMMQEGPHSSTTSMGMTSPVGPHTDTVNYLDWSPDGQRLISASEDRSVRLWDAVTGTCTSVLTELKAKRLVISDVCWSPCGRLVGGADGPTVQVWDVASGECTAELDGHTHAVLCMCWSPDGRQLASGSKDTTVRLWDAGTGQCSMVLAGQPSSVQCVSWRPDGRQLASCCSDDIRVWDAATGQCVAMAATMAGQYFMSVCWSPDGQRLAVAEGMSVRLWDAAAGQCIAVMEQHTDGVASVCWSPDGRWLASGSHDETVRLWDAAEGKCAATLTGHKGIVRCVRWSPDGRQLASGPGDKTIRLWDVSMMQRAS